MEPADLRHRHDIALFWWLDSALVGRVLLESEMIARAGALPRYRGTALFRSPGSPFLRWIKRSRPARGRAQATSRAGRKSNTGASGSARRRISERRGPERSRSRGGVPGPAGRGFVPAALPPACSGSLFVSRARALRQRSRRGRGGPRYLDPRLRAAGRLPLGVGPRHLAVLHRAQPVPRAAPRARPRDGYRPAPRARVARDRGSRGRCESTPTCVHARGSDANTFSHRPRE